MKRAIRVFALLIAVVAVATPAMALDTATTADVNIVEGITCTQTQALNFGDVALYTGNISVAADGTLTDDDFMSYDGTNIAPATFDVTAPVDATLDVSFTYGAAVGGLVLQAADSNWNGGVVTTGATQYVSTGADVLGVGAELNVDASTAVTGAQTVAYTVVITLN